MGRTKKGGGKKKYGLVLTALLVLLPSLLDAQTIPTNPRGVAFTCPDHAVDDGHDVEIRVRATGATVQVINGGDPAAVGGEVTINFNVQPIAFGSYDLVVRAKAGSLSSVNSPAANFDRVPGAPSGTRIVAAIWNTLLRGNAYMGDLLGVTRPLMRRR